MKKKYIHLFFDLDDTLWDTAHNSKVSMQEIFDEYNFGRFYPSFDDFYKVYLEYNNNLWSGYNKGLVKKEDIILYRFYHLFKDFNAFSLEEAQDMNKTFLNKTSFREKTVEGAISLLESLKNRYRLHIISNGFSELQFIKMKRAGLSGYFDQVVLSDKVGVNKPFPYIFEYALDKANAKKDESLMIGDSLETDIKGAQAFGLDQVWFNPSGADPKGIVSTYEVKSLAELSRLLAS